MPNHWAPCPEQTKATFGVVHGAHSAGHQIDWILLSGERLQGRGQFFASRSDHCQSMFKVFPTRCCHVDDVLRFPRRDLSAGDPKGIARVPGGLRPYVLKEEAVKALLCRVGRAVSLALALEWEAKDCRGRAVTEGHSTGQPNAYNATEGVQQRSPLIIAAPARVQCQTIEAGSHEHLSDAAAQQRMWANLQKDGASITHQSLDDLGKEHRLTEVSCPMLRSHLRTFQISAIHGRKEGDSGSCGTQAGQRGSQIFGAPDPCRDCGRPHRHRSASMSLPLLSNS